MSDTTLITKQTEKAILEKTPAKYIKKRQGRGGKQLDYVETGYVINKLNEVFSYMWSFEVVDEKIGETQVYVKGKLTAHLSPTLSITKVQYGGKDIAKGSNGRPIDIGDDMKAASSDALKKCASLFGIAQDVFWPAGKEYTEEPQKEEKTDRPTIQQAQRDNILPITVEQKGDLMILLGKLGKTQPDLNKVVQMKFKKDSYQLLTKNETDALILYMKNSLENKTVGKLESPDLSEEDLEQISQGIEQQKLE